MLNNLIKIKCSSRAILKNFQIKAFFASAQTRIQFTQKLIEEKYYQILGFSKRGNLDSLTDTQIKRRYLAMIKKYHSDSVIDPFQKIDNEEITKCIISAYDKISSARMQQQIDRGVYETIYKDQDQIAMKIFGKKFNQIKYELFKQGNAQKRTKFMQELEKIRKQSKYYDYVKNKQQQYSDNFSQHIKRSRIQPLHMKFADDFIKQMSKNYLPAIGVLGVLIYIYLLKRAQQAEAYRQRRKKQKLTLGKDKVKQIEKRSTQLYEKKLNDLINSFVQEQPPALKYPSRGDPQQIDQLIEYTIGPDINLYQISSNILANQQNLQKLKSLKSLQQAKNQFGLEFHYFPLTKIKINSAITLSLEAERCLQNIYIRVKDVAQQIEQTGKYKPPQIFFRYFGYLMFQIRQKPLTLSNYRDTEYISLFDLFFDYYSPIPLKRHEYNEYLVGFYDQDLKMYGQVHLNHRKIPERYISKDDKIVVMRDKVKFQENKYQQIWDNFYKKYMKIWKRDYGDRISTQHRDH